MTKLHSIMYFGFRAAEIARLALPADFGVTRQAAAVLIIRAPPRPYRQFHRNSRSECRVGREDVPLHVRGKRMWGSFRNRPTFGLVPTPKHVLVAEKHETCRDLSQ